MSVTIKHTDNTNAILSAEERAKRVGLEMIGMKAEGYAKQLAPVGTVESTGKKGYRGGSLRNSITHMTDPDSVTIGSGVEYAPYVELGTGPYFTPPPSWEKFSSSKGSGVGHGYVHARPFLQPAIENHRAEYKNLLKKALGG